jgi:ATP-dependent exoDNAse (exonuclease V) alpha subunit
LINDLAMEVKFGRKACITQIGGDFEDNPENFDRSNKLKAGKPKPSDVQIYKGMDIFLTRNVDKDNDFVNGMQAVVEAFDEDSQSLRVKTVTGVRLSIYKYTDPDPEHHGANFHPVRIGYASTIYKLQGAQLEHVTIWLDCQGAKAAAYVALSRVRHDEDYLLGGRLVAQHFVPAEPV